MTGVLRALIIDDNPDDRLLVRRLLSQAFAGLQAVDVVDPQGLARALEQLDFDLAITECQLRWTSGLEVITALKVQKPDAPVIMFTGMGSEEIAVAAIKAGVDDYVLKSPRHFHRLATVVKAALERAATANRASLLDVRLHGLLDRLNLGVFRTTHDGRLLEANAAFLRLLGLNSLVDALGTNVGEFYADPEDRFLLITRLEHGGSVRDYEVELRRATGEPLWVTLTEIETIGSDGEVIIDGVMKDVGERRRAQRQLEQERNFVSAILDTAATLVIVLERDGRIVRFNRACERVTDYSFDEVRDRTIWDLFVPREASQAVRDLLSRLFGGQFPVEYSGSWRTRSGSVRLVTWSCTGLLDERGAVQFAVWTGEDVTERRRLEEQVRQMQKMQAVGRLAGGIAHDFNNLLTTILGYSALLLDQAEQNATLRHDVLEIQRAADRAADLTRQLLAFGRQQVLQPRQVDLNAILAQLEGMLRRVVSDQVSLEAVTDPDLMPISADPGQIEQVVMNLAVNAVEAMPHGGRLMLETSNIVLGRTAARDGSWIPAGPYVMLRMSDTGAGMDEDTQLHLFEPFFTTKTLGRGAGLGLASAHGIVSQSGGYIDLESTVGRGTTFRVYLPARVEPALPTATLDRPEKETILVVDDEDRIRMLLRDLLQRRGYLVIEAGNGVEALALAGRHNGAIHLLVTDILMPRMGGTELAERLKHLRPGLKVLCVSAFGESEVVREEVLRPGMAFLQKPFTPHTFLTKVREVLDAAEPTPTATPPA